VKARDRFARPVADGDPDRVLPAWCGVRTVEPAASRPRRSRAWGHRNTGMHQCPARRRVLRTRRPEASAGGL